MLFVAIALAAGLVWPGLAGAADVQGTADARAGIGRKVESFTLQDWRGKTHSLEDHREEKLVVVAFLGTECPLVKLYGPRREELSQQYAKQGVVFLGINSNRQDSVTEIGAWASRHNVTFPVLKDAGNRVADAFGAVRTPEVFVLDASRTIRYRGRVDDQYGVGYIRNEPRQRDLALALDALLAGRPVATSVTETVGCHIGRIRTPREDSPVTYSKEIARILQRRCVECHRAGEIAPFALTDYDEVVGWADMIREVTRERRMPPWHADPAHGRFADDRRLTDEELQQIATWVKHGAPEGDPADLPESVEYVTGWQLPRKPDLIVPITEEPVRVQAEGEVKYRYFKVDPGFTEDRWVRAAQLLPGNRAVVHHILVFAREPGQALRGGGTNGFLVGYVPGLISRPFPPGMAKRVPAGSQLIFQMHYTPIGTEQFDHSQLGFVFADDDEVKYEVRTTSAVQRRLNIPAGASDHRVNALSPASPADVLLLGMMPHMHLRGKSFRYEARWPDGTAETLLNVPEYDFNWQTGYRLAEPLKLPAGTRMYCEAGYDNSLDNLNNPDPTVNVKWGDQTWEEMMIGYFDIAFPRELTERSRRARRKPVTEANRRRARVVLGRFDKDGDGVATRNEVPERLHRLFDRLDANRDKRLTVAELAAGLQLLRDGN